MVTRARKRGASAGVKVPALAAGGVVHRGFALMSRVAGLASRLRRCRWASSSFIAGRGQCLVGHGRERVDDEQGGGGVWRELGPAGLAPVPASAGHAGGRRTTPPRQGRDARWRFPVHRRVEGFGACGSQQPRAAAVAGEVLPADWNLVQDRDSVVDVGQPVHSGKAGACPAGQGFEAVAGALRLGAEGAVGLAPGRDVRQLFGGDVGQQRDCRLLGPAQQCLAAGVAGARGEAVDREQ